MATGHFLQQLHQHQVVVVGQVGLFKNRCKLKLVWCHFVVTCGHRNAQLVRLHLEVLHERRHALWNGSEVVVVQLLALRWRRTKQRATCHRQIGTRGVERLVHQEVLLLPTQSGVHLGDVLVEVLAHRGGRSVHGRQRLQQGCLVVERVAGVADENGRDAQGLSPHEGGRSGVPQRVPTCLEGVPNASARERRGVGLLLHQQAAVKLLDRTAIRRGRDEAVVLLRGAACQRLEPVRVVGCTSSNRPLLHRRGGLVGHLPADGGALFHGFQNALVSLIGEVRAHDMEVEHVLSEVLGNLVGRTLHVVGNAVEHLVEGLLTVEAHVK